MPMNHPMRRKDRAISQEECFQILQAGEYCVLASVDSEGMPYATPLSYVFMNGKVYFHAAQEGHKLDNLRAAPRCSLAVIGKTQPVYAKNFTTYYESVVIFGRVEEIYNPTDKTQILTALANKYLPEHMDKAAKDIAVSLDRTAVCAVHIEKMTGKAKRKQ